MGIKLKPQTPVSCLRDSRAQLSLGFVEAPIGQKRDGGGLSKFCRHPDQPNLRIRPSVPERVLSHASKLETYLNQKSISPRESAVKEENRHKIVYLYARK